MALTRGQKTAPCKDCERKGCGSYHDQCEKFLEWQKLMGKGKTDLYEYHANEKMFDDVRMRRKRK